MKRTLMLTSAMAFAGAVAAGPAAAADKMQLSLGGYMNQWVGFTAIEEGGYNEGNKDQYGIAMMTQREGAADVRSNAEVHFKGSLKADSGLTFGVSVELEANNSGVQSDGAANGYKARGAVIDESKAWVSGEFGKLIIGADDSVQSAMHTSVKNAGLDLGEVRMFLPENEAYYTANWQADNKRIIYMTPRMSGIQLGVDYSPGSNENYGHQSDGDLANNDGDSWSMAANMQQDFAGASINMSLGYINKGPENEATNVGIRVSMDGLTAGLAYLDDEGGNREMTVAGLMYSDGPMSVSANFGQTSRTNSDVSIGMLSLGYTLAPGVSAHGSMFSSESDKTKVTKSDGEMADFAGTGLVMGIKLGF